MKTRLHIVVSGRVQGVGYRAGARHKARELLLTGWVQNCNDGSVCIEAEGDYASLNQFVDWCKEGSFLSKVTNVSIQSIPIMGDISFEIRP